MKLRKLIIAVVTVVVLVMGTCMAFADATAENLGEGMEATESQELGPDALVPYVQLDQPLDDSQFEEENEKLVERGREILSSRTRGQSKFLMVPHVYQDGESWSSDIMQTQGYTISNKGCLVTSFTMVVQFNGFGDDPGDVNSRLGDDACLFNWYNDAAPDDYSLNLTSFKSGTKSDSYAKEYIIGAIDAGYPPIVGFERDGGSSTHFVTAFGYNTGLDEIYIQDPYSGRDYGTLDEYLANYHVYRLAQYR